MRPLPLPGATGDPADVDADAIADRVTPTPTPFLPASSDAWMPGQPAMSELPQASDKPPSLTVPSGSVDEAARKLPAAAPPALALPVGMCRPASASALAHGSRQIQATGEERRGGCAGGARSGSKPDTGRAATALVLLQLLLLLLPVAEILHPGGGTTSRAEARPSLPC